MLKTTDFHGSNYHNAKGIQKKIWKYFFDRLIDGQKYVFLHTTRQRINLGHNEISLHSVPYCTDGLSANFWFTTERKRIERNGSLFVNTRIMSCFLAFPFLENLKSCEKKMKKEDLIE